MHYVYVLKLLSYSNKKHAKVGCSKNVGNRIKQLQHCYGGLSSTLIGFFCFPNRAAAFSAETATRRKFKPYRKRPAHEAFDIDAEALVSFLKDRSPEIDFVRAK